MPSKTLLVSLFSGASLAHDIPFWEKSGVFGALYVDKCPEACATLASRYNVPVLEWKGKMTFDQLVEEVSKRRENGEPVVLRASIGRDLVIPGHTIEDVRVLYTREHFRRILQAVNSGNDKLVLLATPPCAATCGVAPKLDRRHALGEWFKDSLIPFFKRLKWIKRAGLCDAITIEIGKLPNKPPPGSRKNTKQPNMSIQLLNALGADFTLFLHSAALYGSASERKRHVFTDNRSSWGQPETLKKSLAKKCDMSQRNVLRGGKEKKAKGWTTYSRSHFTKPKDKTTETYVRRPGEKSHAITTTGLLFLTDDPDGDRKLTLSEHLCLMGVPRREKDTHTVINDISSKNKALGLIGRGITRRLYECLLFGMLGGIRCKTEFERSHWHQEFIRRCSQHKESF